MENYPDGKQNKQKKVKEILENYRKAGQISIKAKDLAGRVCKPGAKAIDICERIEALIRKEGALPAFPVNISINHEAAHYSAEIHDGRIIPEKSIVKIDLGAQIDGYIVDTAKTFNFDPDLDELCNASFQALDNALKIIKPGVKVSEVGKIVEETITKAGFEPIRNLSGHQIKRNILHAGVSIPNTGPGYFERITAKFQAGRIYAIEPFASTGQGWVQNGKTTNIFRYLKDPKSKNLELAKIAKLVKERVGVLPFSPRHLYKPSSGKKGSEMVYQTIKKLLHAKVITGYPVLIEKSVTARVSQHEDTVRITKDGYELLTRNQ
ncbi:MAG: type II methionyl aminopeptidase [Candidatus Heimdallarchaeota archaeon]|nr:type II methionyl aminopeptidase [Candidatus Heimdallarchaeota archaeon]